MMPRDFLISNIFGEDALANWGDSRTVTFQQVYYLGVPVLRVNGINLIDDSTLDRILQADDVRNVLSFHELNQSTPPPKIPWSDFEEWWYSWKTAFAKTEPEDPSKRQKWLFYGGTEFVPIYQASPQEPHLQIVVGYKPQYVGGVATDSEINYIIQGHACAKAGLPLAFGLFGTAVHNAASLTLVPAAKLFWFEKGYNEYEKRKDW